MADLYHELSCDVQKVLDALTDAGFACQSYNRGKQINTEDWGGIIHSFYPSTGTIVLHASNSFSTTGTKVIRGENLDTFMDYLSSPERIRQLF